MILPCLPRSESCLKCRMASLTPREREPLPNPPWASLARLHPAIARTHFETILHADERSQGRTLTSVIDPDLQALRAPVIIAGHPFASLLFLWTPDKEHGNSPYQGQNGHQEKDLGVSSEKIVSQAEGEGPKGR